MIDGRPTRNPASARIPMEMSNLPAALVEVVDGWTITVVTTKVVLLANSVLVGSGRLVQIGAAGVIVDEVVDGILVDVGVDN